LKEFGKDVYSRRRSKGRKCVKQLATLDVPKTLETPITNYANLNDKATVGIWV